ncbi:hypothetical protein [Lacipirellula sp.]|uniref:hypothetical protein n=1 Tax=Lacipirellula sp. TaxID=2691419 RepID=UPI003D11220A
MAKATAKPEEQGDIGSMTEIKLNSRHAESADLYEILVGGRRVAYVIDEAPFPITPLPKGSAKQPTLTNQEWLVVAEKARGEMERIVKERTAEGGELDRIFAGM